MSNSDTSHHVTFLTLFGRFVAMGDVNMVVKLHDLFTNKLMLTELYFEKEFWGTEISKVCRPDEPSQVSSLVADNIPFVASADIAGCDHWAAWNWDFNTFTDGDIGDLKVPVSVPQKSMKRKDDITEEVQLREYIGSFDQLVDASEQRESPPPYLRAWQYRDFAASGHLAGDYSEPEWAIDYFSRLKEDAPKFKWLFVGPAGVRTPLHVDPCLTHAWMAQVKGRKLWKLVPPSSLQYLVDDGGFADLSNIDRKRFPDHSKAAIHEVILNPGEVIFIPQGWAHDVTTLDHGIAITHNFLSKEGFTKVVRQACLSKVLTSKVSEESAA
eukprot:TRINITY_DN9070_c2_g1_i1.p1 TRINITY_DN9070_c2_g1~~TRINITY_DN9070_c2_g1_i1.p1  ORF type:complete len:326 (+),score=60.73 TRINITY_DN9070_c2_g1_i1:107-1084(+)